MEVISLFQPGQEGTGMLAPRKQRRRCAQCPRLKSSAKAGWACSSGPRQWKLAMLTLVPAYVLSLLFQFLPLEALPKPLATLVITVLLVLILTYITQPMLVRGCAKWLCPLPPLHKRQSHRRETMLIGREVDQSRT